MDFQTEPESRKHSSHLLLLIVERFRLQLFLQ
jgi:hypothetical protein